MCLGIREFYCTLSTQNHQLCGGSKDTQSDEGYWDVGKVCQILKFTNIYSIKNPQAPKICLSVPYIERYENLSVDSWKF